MVKHPEIVLFGYGAYITEENAGIAHLDAIMDDPDTYIADIRLEPYSRFQVWSKASLEQRYGRNAQGKRRYVWIEDLGNLNHKKEDRHKGFALKDQNAGLSRLMGALEQGLRIVLLCGCKYYESCHRSLVAQLLLASVPGLRVTHVEQSAEVEMFGERPTVQMQQAALFEVPTAATPQHFDDMPQVKSKARKP